MRQGLKSICFFQRRYDQFIFSKDKMSLMESQYAWVKHLIKQNIKVIYILGGNKEEVINIDIGRIYFIPDVDRKSILSHSRLFYQKARQILKDEGIDLLICHGLSDIISHHFISRTHLTHKVLVQDHGSTYQSKYKLLKPFYSHVDGVLFNSPGQETAWVNADLMQKQEVFFLPESTSSFEIDLDQRLDTLSQSKETKLLWIGNLDQNKDPMTILKGIKILSDINVSLDMIYRQAPLIDTVKAFIKENGIEGKVHLTGPVEHNVIATYLENTHYIVSGSGKEGSGYAIIEAMSCGVVPVLTQIPSFRHFANEGNTGYLYDRGNSLAFATAIRQALTEDYRSKSVLVSKFYKDNFSSEATANKLIDIYAALTDNNKP